ncbi:MAG: ATP-binding protein [Flavobacteriaceae bacterium]|nr:ATP-binding protein [Flavobacteriaceae bacterium]
MTSFDLIIDDKESLDLEELMFNVENKEAVSQVIKEHQYLSELQQYGLEVDNKILLYGYSGCGKTATAKAIAKALNRKILILNLTNFVSSKIGETGKNLKAIFDKAEREQAVLFLDEFDQVAKMRGNDDKDVGEMRRLVNTLIQLIDYFPKNALLIAATNHPELIDTALMRRFQLKLKYEMPTKEQLNAYYDTQLKTFPERFQKIERKYGISYAEAQDYVRTLMKRLIIKELESKK